MNYFEEQAENLFWDLKPEYDSNQMKRVIVRYLQNAALAGRMDSHIAELAMNGGYGGG